MPKTSAAEFALEVRENRLTFEEALVEHLLKRHPDGLTLYFVWAMSIVIRYAAVGLWGNSITLPDAEESSVREIIESYGLKPFVDVTVEANRKIIWHGQPCPQEYLAKVETELAGMLGEMLDSPQQLGYHRIFLDNGGEVTAWGETSDESFHAEYHDAPTTERADQALFDRIRNLFKVQIS